MQTFLPYADFRMSANCLDDKRLRNQRLEVLQLLRTNTGLSDGWANHPAAKMWKGYESALSRYGLTVCRVCRERGFQDKIGALLERHYLPKDNRFPDWLGDKRVHASHRSNLLRKDFEWYSQFGWKEGPSLDYFWPV